MGLSFQGDYSSVTNYALGDGVRYNGADYVSLQRKQPWQYSRPEPNMQWALFAQDGAAGATGPAGATGLTGATGPAGIQGIQGIQGVQGPIGLPGMTYQGAWTNGTGYAVNDAVTYNGSTYIATQGNSSNRPDNYPTVWSLLAAAGVAGLARSGGGDRRTTGPAGAPDRQAHWRDRAAGASRNLHPWRMADRNNIRGGRCCQLCQRLQLYLASGE